MVKKLCNEQKSLEGKIVNLSLDGLSNVRNGPSVCACRTTGEGKGFFAETTDTQQQT